MDDYALIRDAIAKTFPEIFHDFNARFETPGGFPRPVAARNRVWKTERSKANFIAPTTVKPSHDAPNDRGRRRGRAAPHDACAATTSSTRPIYSLDDRFRGIEGTRKVLLMNPADIARLGLEEGAEVTARTAANDGVEREVPGLSVRAHALPSGAVAGYYPELNPLVPLWHHAKESKVPAAKSVAVRIVRTSAR